MRMFSVLLEDICEITFEYLFSARPGIYFTANARYSTPLVHNFVEKILRVEFRFLTKRCSAEN
jgi:hypothetical protein